MSQNLPLQVFNKGFPSGDFDNPHAQAKWQGVGRLGLE
jgi:hypothetical protein